MRSAVRLHAALALVALLSFEGTAAAGNVASTGERSCCLCTVSLFSYIACRLGTGTSTCAPPGRQLLGRFQPEPKPELPPEHRPGPEPRPGPQPTSLVRPPWVALGSAAPEELPQVALARPQSASGWPRCTPPPRRLPLRRLVLLQRGKARS